MRNGHAYPARPAAPRQPKGRLLVVSAARHHLGRGPPLLDLIQEGNVGLMRAAEAIYRLAFVGRRLRADLQREPAVAEIAGELGVSPARVRAIRRYAQQPVSLQERVGFGVTRERIRQIETRSLSALAERGDGAGWHDLLD